MKRTYRQTIAACFVGYIVQAIVNNFVPLLFLTFHERFGIPMSKITLLVTVNFGLQLLVDLVSVRFVDRLGYRACAVLAHGAAAAGLVALAVLPRLLPDPFVGILISVALYALGGGLLEVLVSPIVEACPSEHKEQTMSMLHSFYCWGHVGVVLLSTLFFQVFGIGAWPVLALLWAAIPLCNGVFFSMVPIAPLVREDERGIPLGKLLRMKLFWILLLMMTCSGACEQAVSQWASAFAEQGLGVSKTMGDLMGPMLFALLMGTSRAIYGKWGERLPLERFMLLSCGTCMVSYLMIVLSPSPVVGLLGCGLCGFSVGILWPGTFSLASASMRAGGTALFALLALGGDLGCSGGPTLVGLVAGADGNLRRGILAALVFPALLLICLALRKKASASQPERS